MRVALVCDWLTNVGGAEKVLLRLHKLYPEAPIYTSKYDPRGIDWFRDADVRTGWLQKFPTKLRRVLGPLRQRYFSKLDLSEYDLIISVTGAEAKAVKSGRRLHEEGKKNVKNPRGIHISYCHVPTQYYWQMYDDYVKNPGFGVLNPLVRLIFRLLVRPLRRADYKAAQSPDYYVTISEYAKEMIAKYYRREGVVIHPPVEVKAFSRSDDAVTESLVAFSLASVVTGLASKSAPVVAHAPRDSVTVSSSQESDSKPRKNIERTSHYYIVTSRQVNWKRIDLAVKACMMTQRKLLVIGEGPEHKKLVKLAGNTGLIEFLPLMEKDELVRYLARARGYLFPSLEPFGIAPVEALAAGCPVVAYGEGGARDYVEEGKNGIFFEKQTAKSLAEAILKFEKCKFNRSKVAKSVEKFGEDRFDNEIKNFVKKCEKKNAK